MMQPEQLLAHDEFWVVTVIPYTENPTERVERMNKQELETFLHSYTDFAEELIAVLPVEDTPEASTARWAE